MREIPKTLRPLIYLLTGAFILYLLLAPRYHVGGVYNDDGMYVLAAKSLAQGHYSQLNIPGHPPFTLYPPGFPLLLAPITMLVGSHLALLKAVPIALTLIYVTLLWVISRTSLSPHWRLLWLFICAFNPVVTMFSNLLMAEPLYLVILVAIFILLEREPEDPSGKAAWGIGVLMGWLSLTRIEGIVILPAVVLGLAYNRRWQSLRKSLLAAFLLGGLYAVRNAWISTSSSIYQRGWTLVWEEIQRHPMVLLQNITDGLSIFVLQNTLSPWIPTHGLPLPVIAALGLGGTCAAMYGAWLLWKEQPGSRALVITLATYTLFFVGLHTFWLTTELRYGLSILPIVLAGIFKAIETWVKKKPQQKAGMTGFISLLIIGYMAQNAYAVYLAWTAPDQTHPGDTYQWIASRLPPRALLLSSGPAALYLHTGRYATLEAAATNGEEFRFRLLTDGIDYVVLRPSDFGSPNLAGEDPNRFWALRRRWVIGQPNAFRLVYENPREQRAIIKLHDQLKFK
jgi:hypothetical protein